MSSSRSARLLLLSSFAAQVAGVALSAAYASAGQLEADFSSVPPQVEAVALNPTGLRPTFPKLCSTQIR